MTVQIDLVKVGDKWYPSINHESLDSLQFNDLANRFLNKIDFIKIGKLSMLIRTSHSVIGSKGIVQFSIEDLIRYQETDDWFFMKFYIDDHEFEITSDLFGLLEAQYGFDFAGGFYQLEIW